MSDVPFYPISNLSDILSKFRAELNLALQDVYKRIETLEAQLTQGAYSTSGLIAPEIMKAGVGYAEYEYPREPEEGVSGADALSMQDMYVATLQARRALYGYAMALESLGLPKEQKAAIRQMEDMITAAIRMYQTFMMIQEAITIFTAAGAFTPMGAFYLVAAGGMGLASLMYMGRAGGG